MDWQKRAWNCCKGGAGAAAALQTAMWACHNMVHHPTATTALLHLEISWDILLWQQYLIYQIYSTPTFVATKVGYCWHMYCWHGNEGRWKIILQIGVLCGVMYWQLCIYLKVWSVGMYLSFLDAITVGIVYPAVMTMMEKHHAEIRGKGYGENRWRMALCGMYPISNEINQTSGQGWLLHLLNSTVQSQSTETEDDDILSIAVRAAETMKRYLSWVDLWWWTDISIVCGGEQLNRVHRSRLLQRLQNLSIQLYLNCARMGGWSYIANNKY